MKSEEFLNLVTTSEEARNYIAEQVAECGICQKPFIKKKTLQEYCSRACAGQVARKRLKSGAPLSDNGRSPNRILYTMEEASQILGISSSALYRWGRNGIIKTVVIGSTRRIHIQEINRLVTEGSFSPLGDEDPNETNRQL